MTLRERMEYGDLSEDELEQEPVRKPVDRGLAAQLRDYIQAQQGDLAEAEGAVKRYAARPPKLDLSPLVGLADAWTGSKLSSTYRPPPSEDERALTEAKLRDYVADQRAGLGRELTRLAVASGKRGAGELSPYQQFLQGRSREDSIARLRQEATSGQFGKLYENYQNSVRAQGALKEFAADPSGYSDYGTLMLALKTLQGDQSVVRETEIRLGQNAASIIDKAKNAIQRGVDGKNLQPGQREDIQKALGTLSSVSRKQYLQATKPLYDQVKRRGLPADEVFSNAGDYEFLNLKKPTQVTQSDWDDATPEERAQLVNHFKAKPKTKK